MPRPWLTNALSASMQPSQWSKSQCRFCRHRRVHVEAVIAKCSIEPQLRSSFWQLVVAQVAPSGALVGVSEQAYECSNASNRALLDVTATMNETLLKSVDGEMARRKLIGNSTILIGRRDASHTNATKGDDERPRGDAGRRSVCRWTRPGWQCRIWGQHPNCSERGADIEAGTFWCREKPRTLGRAEARCQWGRVGAKEALAI